MGKKGKKLWKSIPPYIFWTIWKERNRLPFKGGVLAFQKLKTSFVYNLWGWGVGLKCTLIWSRIP